MAGPSNPPSPWIQSGETISYGGAVVIGAPAGGQQGANSLNVQFLYINGEAFADAVAAAVGDGFAAYLAGLPTSLPGSPGVPWNNGGVVSIS